MGAFVERNHHGSRFDVNRGGHVQQIVEEGLRLRVSIGAPKLVRQHAVQRTGHECDLQIEIDAQTDHRRQGIQMKKLDGFRDAVLNEHALGVAGHQGGAADFEVIGQQDSRFFVAQVDDRDLTDWLAVIGKTDVFIKHLGSAELACQGRQSDPLPGGCGATPDGTQHLARPSAERDEVNVALVEAV